MIHANRIVTVGDQESIIDRPIVLYRGDREVEIEFTLVGNEFMFSEEGNVIKSVNASHGQLVLNTPSGEHMFSELAECHEGKVVFVVTKEMIDEFIEMGFYSFQIRLYDSAEMKSRVTIPPVMNGFDIRNPIAAEDETNVVDQGIVDYARIFKDQSNEELPTFDWTGAYNKTEWVHHDVITENKMNKIEDALYSINANIKESDVVMINTLDQVKYDADKYVKEHMAEVEADVEEFERNLNTGVEKFKVDTNDAMTAHKNEVEKINEELAAQIEHFRCTADIPTYNLREITAELGVTAGIQSVFNEVKETGVGRILLDQVYEIDEPLVLERTNNNIVTSIEIYGGGCIKKSPAFVGDRLLLIKIGYHDEDNILFNNISFDGVDKKVNGVDTFNMDLPYDSECTDKAQHNESKFVKFYNCSFVHCYHGVRLSALSWVFSGCLFHSNIYGIYLDCSANGITFLGCSIRRNVIGAKFKQFDATIGTIANGLYNCTVESNRNVGFISKRSRNTTLIGNYFENNGTNKNTSYEYPSDANVADKSVHIWLADSGGAGRSFFKNFFNDAGFAMYGEFPYSTVIGPCSIGMRHASSATFINMNINHIAFFGMGNYTSSFYVNGAEYKTTTDLAVYRPDTRVNGIGKYPAVGLNKKVNIASSMDILNIEIPETIRLVNGGAMICDVNISLIGTTSSGNTHSAGAITGKIIFTKGSDGTNRYVANTDLKLWYTGGAPAGNTTGGIMNWLFDGNSSVNVRVEDGYVTIIHLDGVVNNSMVNWGKCTTIDVAVTCECMLVRNNAIGHDTPIIILS